MPRSDLFRHWTSLARSTEALAAAATLDQVLILLSERAREFAGCDGAKTIRCEDGEAILVGYVGETGVAPHWPAARVPIQRAVSGLAFTERRPILIPDVRADSRVMPESYRHTEMRGAALFPIGAPRPIGALGLYWSRPQPRDRGGLALVDGLTWSANAALQRLSVTLERGTGTDRPA